MRGNDGHPARVAWLIVAGLIASCWCAAGCGSSRRQRAGRPPASCRAVGKGEGELNLVAWAGYVEDGSTDPTSTG